MRIISLLLVVIALLCIIPTGQAWLTGYLYRMPIEIENTDGALTNFQYNFTIDTASLVSAGYMNANGSDCRITGPDTDTLLPFWNETNFNSASTKIWVRAPSLAGSGNTTHYIYYGKPTAANISSGVNTFTQWRGLSTSAYDMAHVVQGPSFIYEARVQMTSSSHDIRYGLRNAGTFDDSVNFEIYSPTSITYLYCYDEGSVSSTHSAKSFSVNQWYDLKINYTTGNMDGFVDGSQIGSSITTNLPNEYMGMMVMTATGSTRQDWAFVRNYTAHQPFATHGAQSDIFLPPELTYEKGTYNNGTGYIDYSWTSVESSYITDSFNFTINGGAYTNGSTLTAISYSLSSLAWANFTIYGYNLTSDVLTDPTNEDQQIPPNAPTTPGLVLPTNNYVLFNEYNITLECTTSTCDWPITYHFYDNGVEVGSSSDTDFEYNTTGNYGVHQWYVIASHGYLSNNSASVTRQFTVLQAPELLSPGNGSTHNYEYPPQMHDITLSWSDYGAPSYRMIIARDINFTQTVYDSYYTGNSTVLTLEADEYFWKVATYNGDIANHSNYSATNNFTITETTPSLGTGVQGVCYDVNNVPLSGVLVTIWNQTYSTTYMTGANGYYVFVDNIKAGNYSVQGTKDEYDNSVIYMVYIVSDATTTRDVYLDPLQGEYDWHHYVRLTVQSIWGTKYPDINVKAYLPNSASPCLTGTTGTDGSIAWHMDQDIRYRFTFEADTIDNKEMYFYPTSNQYYIIVSYDDSTFDEDSTESNIIGISVAHYPGTNGSVDISYNDKMDCTTALNFTIRERLVNGTYIYTDSYNTFTNMSDGTHRFILTTYSNKEYVVFVNYTHDEYGDRQRNFGVSYGNTIAVLDNIFGPFIKGMLAMFILISVGLVFGITNREIGALLTSLTGAILHSMGWFNYYNVPSLTIWAGISLALIISIAAIFGKKS